MTLAHKGSREQDDDLLRSWYWQRLHPALRKFNEGLAIRNLGKHGVPSVPRLQHYRGPLHWMQEGELGRDIGEQFDALPTRWESGAVLRLRPENISDW
jgi:hypothetical protein